MQHIGYNFCTNPCNSVHNRWCFWTKKSWITYWFNLDSSMLTFFVQASKLSFEQSIMQPYKNHDMVVSYVTSLPPFY